MRMPYMLLDLTTGNVLGFYETEEDGIDAVAENLEGEDEAAEGLALDFVGPDGPEYVVAQGAGLVHRAAARKQWRAARFRPVVIAPAWLTPSTGTNYTWVGTSNWDNPSSMPVAGEVALSR